MARRFSSGVKRFGDPRKGRKAKAVKVEALPTDGYAYRSRPTTPGPFGDAEPPFLGPLAAVLERHAVDAELGMEPVLEYRVKGAPWMQYRPPVTMEHLKRLGLARENSYTYVLPATGESKTETRWNIDPEGQRMIYDAMGVPGGSDR